MRLEKETFGPVLRAARERKGVTLKQLAAETKLSVELWESLEENDLTRWPKRVFARSYVRDYALRVGLDADDVVNDFCRLFPEWGDRRAEHVIREKAQIIAHDLEWEDLPTPQQRRASDRANARRRDSSAAPGADHRRRDRRGGDVRAGMRRPCCSASITGSRRPSPHRPIRSLGAVFLGRSFGLVASEWLLRTLGGRPATRRLVSSRAQNA